MRHNPIAARLGKQADGSAELVIRAADVTIRTEFRDLVACAFPTGTTPPIHVSLKASGSSAFKLAPGVSAGRKPEDDGSWHSVLFPVYQNQAIVDRRIFEQTSRSSVGQVLTRMPVAALAAGAIAEVDGTLYETHCVLPIWNDGSAILVRLDWFRSYTKNPPLWRVSSSSGLPVTAALRQFAEVPPVATLGKPLRYRLCVSPRLLGAELLGYEGRDLRERIWQREWRYDAFDVFSDDISRIVRALLDAGPSGAA